LSSTVKFQNFTMAGAISDWDFKFHGEIAPSTLESRISP